MSSLGSSYPDCTSIKESLATIPPMLCPRRTILRGEGYREMMYRMEWAT
jgi:hypothetical protein